MFSKVIASNVETRHSHRASKVLLGCLAATLVVPAPANAGFFDFLFNPKAPIWNPFAPQPEVVQPTQRPAPPRKKKPNLAARNLRLLEKTRPSGLPLASRDFMDDKSLRDGDAVMTPNGLRIFTGPRGDRHRPESFARLDQIKGLGKHERAALAALDGRPVAGSGADDKQRLATGRSSAGPVAAGAVITDPKGRAIRYVGP